VLLHPFLSIALIDLEQRELDGRRDILCAVIHDNADDDDIGDLKCRRPVLTVDGTRQIGGP
jgi:hypothetical protein